MRLADKLWDRVHGSGMANAWSEDVQRFVRHLSVPQVQRIVRERHPAIVLRIPLASKLSLLPQWLHASACAVALSGGTLEVDVDTIAADSEGCEHGVCTFLQQVAAVLRPAAAAVAPGAATAAPSDLPCKHIIIRAQRQSSSQSVIHHEHAMRGGAVLALMQAALSAHASVTLDSPPQLTQWQTDHVPVQSIRALRVGGEPNSSDICRYGSLLMRVPQMTQLTSLQCDVTPSWRVAYITALASAPAGCDIAVNVKTCGERRVKSSVICIMMTMARLRSVSIVQMQDEYGCALVVAVLLTRVSALSRLEVCGDALEHADHLCFGLNSMRHSLCSFTTCSAQIVPTSVLQSVGGLTGVLIRQRACFQSCST